MTTLDIVCSTFDHILLSCFTFAFDSSVLNDGLDRLLVRCSLLHFCRTGFFRIRVYQRWLIRDSWLRFLYVSWNQPTSRLLSKRSILVVLIPPTTTTNLFKCFVKLFAKPWSLKEFLAVSEVTDLILNLRQEQLSILLCSFRCTLCDILYVHAA